MRYINLRFTFFTSLYFFHNSNRLLNLSSTLSYVSTKMFLKYARLILFIFNYRINNPRNGPDGTERITLRQPLRVIVDRDNPNW